VRERITEERRQGGAAVREGAAEIAQGQRVVGGEDEVADDGQRQGDLDLATAQRADGAAYVLVVVGAELAVQQRKGAGEESEDEERRQSPQPGGAHGGQGIR
jgi:hypothetical protein